MKVPALVRLLFWRERQTVITEVRKNTRCQTLVGAVEKNELRKEEKWGDFFLLYVLMYFLTNKYYIYDQRKILKKK